MSVKAKFKPRFPEKYLGDPTDIQARSTWEITGMKYFDTMKAVLGWSSECIKIPYVSPIDNKIHHYIPDFFVVYKDASGEIHKEIIEVKPRHEADEKYAKSERSKKALLLNNAKWNAARLYCELAEIEFRVLTEQELFHQKKKKVNGTV